MGPICFRFPACAATLTISEASSVKVIILGAQKPTLVALGEHVWLDNRDERFAAGINALIDGLERTQRPIPPTS